MTDAAFDGREHRYGRRCKISWEDGRPVDRWGRSGPEIRAHIAFVTRLIAEQRSIARDCEDVLIGREAGPRFWTRLDGIVVTLERVVERDVWYAESLEEADTAERARRAAPRNGGVV